MDKCVDIEAFRSLSQLEIDMRKAERAYIEADAREREAESILREAESHFLSAQSDRDAKLQSLNQCHAEIDRTLVMLREVSPTGSEWRRQADRGAYQLKLASEGGAANATPNEFILKS